MISEEILLFPGSVGFLFSADSVLGLGIHFFFLYKNLFYNNVEDEI